MGGKSTYIRSVSLFFLPFLRGGEGVGRGGGGIE